ncbi:GFA family protein [Mesorhizobium sp. CN2-181]|uniref:GFA family protein n=1 Tax=Mesorhizobium yinganensis TaxID=3157707 RepID=UPI0032B7A310
MSDASNHAGGCRCGAVRFEARAEPHHVSYCHCDDCRHASGAPVAAFVGFMANEVTMHGEAARFSNGPVARSFCGTCGAPIAYTDARIGDRIYFMLGAMDQPALYHPTHHSYVRSQLPFVHMPDGLPRHDRSSVQRPDGT